MKDRWLNTGYHGDDLKPYVEPSRDIDSERIGKLTHVFSVEWQVTLCDPI